ncbi:Signal transduction histidine kinase [Paenibacillus sp. UNC496MF]|uniref:sensor histidine kinase n=1 Tax=Paenibacillus sp. UNC496MF TaxID=1502753 RepID=UPI0008F3CDDE|nr:sensor histidine kinase [Paenibacillus sp. UNC496MF]SFI77555.1 Signal transduction histidine kinase [Paenibacillus sp. UNC496MF]
MDLQDRRFVIRAAAVTVFIALLMHLNGFFAGSPVKIALNVLIWATFVSRFVLRAFWQPRAMSIAFVGLVALETAAGIIWFKENVLIYYLAAIVVTTAIRLFLGPRRVPLLAAMIAVTLLYTALGEVNLTSFASFVIIAVFFYVNVRSRRERDSAYEANKRHLAELQEAYAHLQEASAASMRNAVLDERARIARDIHDAVGHSLTSLIVQMQALRYMIAQDPAQAEQSLSGMLGVARQGLQDIRTSVHALADDRAVSGLAPLRALLARMEATAGVGYAFRSELAEDEAGEADGALLFSVLQEAITNLVRHSGATRADVRLYRENGRIVLLVRDDGRAGAAGGVREGFGLKTMRARLEEQGGRLTWRAAEPHGFEIKAELPDGSGEETGDRDDDDGR